MAEFTDGYLYSGTSWNVDETGNIVLGQPVSLSYSYLTAIPYYYGNSPLPLFGLNDPTRFSSFADPVQTDWITVALTNSWNTVAKELAVDGARYALSPGMQVSSEINLGTRSVLEYVLSPVQKAWHEAARER